MSLPTGCAAGLIRVFKGTIDSRSKNNIHQSLMVDMMKEGKSGEGMGVKGEEMVVDEGEINQ